MQENTPKQNTGTHIGNKQVFSTVEVLTLSITPYKKFEQIIQRE
jgi:hypothetical protein